MEDINKELIQEIKKLFVTKKKAKTVIMKHLDYSGMGNTAVNQVCEEILADLDLIE